MTSPPPIPAHIFRAYDIRGIVGQGIDADSVFRIGQAVGSEAIDRGEDTLITGADARLSSPELSVALINGILATGCHVCDLGVVPTPLLYYATHVLASGSGAMLTGSHNPGEYNGIKIVLKKQALADDQIQALHTRIIENRLHAGQGNYTRHDISQAYIDRVTSDIALRKSYKVVLDCGNGVTGLFAPQLFSELGCHVVQLYCKPDGNFPHHHPDPTRAENLVDLVDAVARNSADLGIAFDGDGDRVGLITARGSIIDTDQLLLAFIMDLLPDNPGASVVFDVKSSHYLDKVIRASGGVPVMCKSGHSFVKQKVQETEALFGGEYSAHIFFRHRWFGFDDGMYVAARFLELMDRYHATADDLLERMPKSVSTPELFIPVTEEEKFPVMDLIREKLFFKDATCNYLDGIRVDFAQGWGLIRASNTTPNLVLRFEADTESALQELKLIFQQHLHALLPGLNLPI